MNGTNSGFREIEHTADWEIEVWAPDLIGLLKQAARGMYALCGVELKSGPRRRCELDLRAADAESLLVDFLAELLFLGETEELAFDQFELELKDLALHATLYGAPIEKLDKEIKAVTYHRLEVRQTEHGLRVNVVFDV